MRQKQVWLSGAALAAALMFWDSPSLAQQQWPAKAVRIVIPFGAGGGTDIQARLLSQKFQASMGQSFLVDNRAGAAGLIGAEIVAKSPGDGYSILFTTASLAVNITLYGKRVTFDPHTDLIPISWISSVPLVLVVHRSVPVKNVREFVALAKKTGRMTAAHNGSGTTSHLSIEMLKLFAGVNITPVPYKGGGPALVAQISGETDFTFATTLASLPYVKSGKLKGLAVTTAKKSSAFPELPTMNSIYPEFESDNWYAMFFPKGVPKEIVTKMNAEIIKALKSSDINDFIRKEGGEPVGSSSDELRTYFKREVEKYAKVIKAANVVGD